MGIIPAVQHGSGVWEADEHVGRGRGPVQPVQLVPYVVRGHGEESIERLARRQNQTTIATTRIEDEIFFLFSLSLKLFVLSPEQRSAGCRTNG